MKPFTFTEQEREQLRAVGRMIAREAEGEMPGWRVEVVKLVIELRRVVHRAVMRG